MAASGKYVYETPWPMYSMAWALRTEPRMRLALGSFCNQEKNFIRVVELNDETRCFEKVAEVEQTFPATKLMWKPHDSACGSVCPDGNLLASSTCSINLHWLKDGQLKHVGKLPTGHKSSPPLTSFDWSPIHEQKIIGSSVDTTCLVWDLEKMKIETALIAHDKEVYDVCVGQRESNASLFGTVGADGSVRFFDQRSLQHSTIFYETSPVVPLLRLAWNTKDKNYLATFGTDMTGVIILDHRRPTVALKEISTEGRCVNSIAWAPHSRNHLICGTEDGSALIVDVSGGKSETSLQQYDAQQDVYQVLWPGTAPDHVALGTSQQLEVLRL